VLGMPEIGESLGAAATYGVLAQNLSDAGSVCRPRLAPSLLYGSQAADFRWWKEGSAFATDGGWTSRLRRDHRRAKSSRADDDGERQCKHRPFGSIGFVQIALEDIEVGRPQERRCGGNQIEGERRAKWPA